jgi:hypothetical protein
MRPVLVPVARGASVPARLRPRLVFAIIGIAAQVLPLPAPPALAPARGSGPVVLIWGLQTRVKRIAAGHAAAGGIHGAPHTVEDNLEPSRQRIDVSAPGGVQPVSQSVGVNAGQRASSGCGNQRRSHVLWRIGLRARRDACENLRAC